ncbi:MAG: hypothetical protein M1827_002113 [Pycnora praestabilis]|nr:MAG: hypothetical protein M1827_002113 [Pycnora praestabilis]
MSGSISAGYLSALRSKKDQVGDAAVTPAEYGQVFLTPIEFGSESFDVILDTGSSDTWLAQTGFQCISLETDAPVPESDCNFGPTWNVTSGFSQIANENFNITYGDGEFLLGVLGYQQVTFAGITLTQEVAAVNFAAWEGDGISSGLVGMAFPAITSAYAGPEQDASADTQSLEYNPIFTSMYTENLVAPLFTLALSRDATGGVLAIGGLPDVFYYPEFANTSIEIFSMIDVPNNTTQYTFYAITPAGLTFTPAYTQYSVEHATDFEAIVDSGTTLIYLPTFLADEINAFFDPPAFFNETAGAYTVACGAAVPLFGVQIDSQTFYINGQDLIVNNGDGTCVTAINDGEDGPYILGDPFLKNVLAIFDVGASEMRFAAREVY